jgi:hypothetical protein
VVGIGQVNLKLQVVVQVDFVVLSNNAVIGVIVDLKVEDLELHGKRYAL